MNRCRAFALVGSIALGVLVGEGAAHTPDEVIALWPGTPPGVSQAKGPEKKVEGRPRPFFQLTDIATPTLEVFRAPSETQTGTAVLVVPGGGLQRLAYEHEGLEVAEWLNTQGITAFVLKYRVPAPAQTGLIDAQRAMGLIRAGAAKWQVDPEAVGFAGFSAGGEIGAWLITHSSERAYERVDAADDQSCRPDFAGLIYSGGLTQRGGGLKDGIATNLNRSLPPIYLAHAFDDASENSLQLALALKRAGVPTEFHLFHEGAHGFGARDTGVAAGSWKQQFVTWLAAHGHMDASPLRTLARDSVAAIAEGKAPPAFASRLPQGTLADAYTVQRRIVRVAQATDRVKGYKGAGASATAQRALGINAPLTGVLFNSGHLEARPDLVIERAAGEAIVVETEIGYVMGVDFSFAVPTDAHARDAVAEIVPVIELPRSYAASGATPDARNLVASNVGSARYIVGQSIKPGTADPNAWRISLRRDGALLHETTGDSANGGQWQNLRSIINQVTAQGHVIRAGDIIICGALGKVQPGEPGKYEARFGDVETISFEVH
jgi:2-keto-4-pentenoate hydratase/acetyl esterase/lipase